MNTQDISQPIPKVQPRFYDVALMLALDYHELQQISKSAGIDDDIMNDMFLSVPVHRVDAEKYLAEFSKYTGKTWTLQNTRVVLLPTFADVCQIHQNVDLTKVVSTSGVSHDILTLMALGKPVPEDKARYVLRALSQETGKHLCLENIDVAIIADREGPLTTNDRK